MSSESRSPDFLAGYRNAARTAVAWLHKRATEMGDPQAKAILDARAFEMGAAFKYGKIEDEARPSTQDREAVIEECRRIVHRVHEKWAGVRDACPSGSPQRMVAQASVVATSDVIMALHVLLPSEANNRSLTPESGK